MARNDQIVRTLSVARAMAASRRGVNLKDLAAREGWNQRTLYRDKDALEAAGFPVEEASRGRFRMREGWAPPNLPDLHPDEIAAFFGLRAVAEAWRGTSLGRPLDRLWAKLATGRARQGALVPPSAEPWMTVRSPLGIDYRHHEQTIAALQRSLRDRRIARVRYRALSTGESTTRDLEPGDLHWDPGLESLYVIGWCHLREAVRVFAVHRFVDVKVTETPFVPRPETRSKAALRNAFRIWRGDHVEAVRLRFSSTVAAEIRERTWGPGQRIEDARAGSLVLTLEVAESTELARWILGYAGAAEVLAPARLRDRVAGMLRAGAAVYGDARRPARRAGRRGAQGGDESLTWDDKRGG